jgi:hypothetical protein
VDVVRDRLDLERRDIEVVRESPRRFAHRGGVRLVARRAVTGLARVAFGRSRLRRFKDIVERRFVLDFRRASRYSDG